MNIDDEIDCSRHCSHCKTYLLVAKFFNFVECSVACGCNNSTMLPAQFRQNVVCYSELCYKYRRGINDKQVELTTSIVFALGLHLRLIWGTESMTNSMKSNNVSWTTVIIEHCSNRKEFLILFLSFCNIDIPHFVKCLVSVLRGTHVKFPRKRSIKLASAQGELLCYWDLMLTLVIFLLH